VSSVDGKLLNTMTLNYKGGSPNNRGGSKANRVNFEIIKARRRLVASLRLRGLSQYEIHAMFGKSELAGSKNPKDGKPWSIGTVNADCQALERQWHAESLEDTNRLKAKVLAELREARRKAWQDGDLKWVLQSLKQECELLGLDAPTKIDIETRIRIMAEAEGLDPDEVLKEAQRIMNAARSR